MKKSILISVLSMLATVATASPSSTISQHPLNLPVPWHVQSMSNPATFTVYGGTYYVILQDAGYNSGNTATVDCGDGTTKGTISQQHPMQECDLYAMGGKYYTVSITPTKDLGTDPMSGVFTTSLAKTH